MEGRVLNAEGSPAGAHVTTASSLARSGIVAGVATSAALCMAVTVPARVNGRPDLVQIAGRDAADLLVPCAGLVVVGTCATLAV